MTKGYGLFAAASFAIFMWMAGSEADELALLDLGVFVTAVVAVVVSQLLAIWLIVRLSPPWFHRHVLPLLLAVLLAANAYHFALLGLEASKASAIALSAAIGAIFTVAVSIKQFRSVFGTFLAIMIGMSIFQYVQTRLSLNSASVQTAALKLNSTRNVYLIGFESLQSAKAYHDIYGITDLPHLHYLRDAGFRAFDRSYSGHLSTLSSWGRVLEFKLPVGIKKEEQRIPFARGNSTFSSFRGSGYKIQFLYRNTYFGVNPGLVDFAHPKPDFSACDFLPENFVYGLCHNTAKAEINALLGGNQPRNARYLLSVFRKRVDAVVTSGQPWLTVMHLTHLGHTPVDHHYSNEKSMAYWRGRAQKMVPETVRFVREALSYIIEKDPTAIIITFGDHGAKLTRGADEAGSKSPFTPQQLLEDRYGVMLAVYPKDFCVNRIFEGSTTSSAVRSAIACLNGDDKPTSEDIEAAQMIDVDGWKRFSDVLASFKGSFASAH